MAYELNNANWSNCTRARTLEQVAQLVDVARLHHLPAKLLVERQVEHQAQHEALQVSALVGQQLQQKRHERSLFLRRNSSEKRRSKESDIKATP